ncbi:methyl-accepting chemotaxis protein [Roseateles cavernae]|uniref:methyl-accepting chemotaxis protein n=1 Tax=Roseateles cavernae TaxID=3153578 RepID=UPI0032E501D5
MLTLDHLGLRSKLLLAPLICLGLLLLTAAGAMWGFAQQRQALDALESQRLPSYTFLAQFDAGLRDMNGLINRSIGYESMGYNAQEIGAVDAALKQVQTGLQQSLQARLEAATDTEERVQLQELAKGLAAYAKAVEETLGMKSAGAVMAVTFLSTAQTQYDKLLTVVSRQATADLQHAGAEVGAARAQARRLGLAIPAVALVALLTGVLLSLWLAGGLVRRVQTLTQAADHLAAGDLTQQLDAQGRDEIGHLTRAMALVRDRLAGSLAEVREAADSVRTAAGEISAGNTDLSQRTEQQASQLQQTASSMADMNGRVRENAETARQASELALEASAVAVKGGEAVAKVVSTMHDIAGSSQRIGDIISTIDGIAFQTNILALNAAVEAARAGEQGRGFAVVAAEVRVLAQRSAEAAKQIKTLIGASAENVEQGTRLVDQAGRTMQDVVAQIQRVSQLMIGLTEASHTQTQGLGEVSQAVGQLDQVTQQNAALVEESAAAAESLLQQAARLSDTVAVFRLT